MINMNKCIRQNWKIFNRIRFEPIGFDLDFKEPVQSQIWSENQWNHIVNDELTRLSIYSRRLPENKYTITLWNDDEYIYLVQCIRTEYNTDDTLVYIAYNNENNISDFKNIAKFIHKNILNIIKGSQSNVAEFNRLAALMEEADGNA